MADTVTLPGTGAVIASDDISGAQYQRIKLVIGADGTNDGDVASGNPLPITGALTDTQLRATAVPVTASAGTNLNTSALALETGGNLAGAATSLAVIDDWDETDRCKVNPIAGQAGVQGGSGVVTALTQRTVLATDVGLPAGTSDIGAVTSRPSLFAISVQSAGLTTATTNYSAGDQVGTLFTLANAARASGGGGYITGVTLISAADVIGAFDVVFFDASVTLASDNAAFAISDTDALEIVGIAQLAGAFAIGNNRVAQAYNLAMPYICTGTSLFAALITRNGGFVFGAVGDLQLRVWVDRA